MSLADTKEAFDILDPGLGTSISVINLGQIGPGITALPTILLSYSFELGATQRGGKFTSRGHQFIFSPSGMPEGKELVDELWLEAKPPAGSWTPVGGNTMLEITPATQELELRLNIPTNAVTKGFFQWAIEILFGPDGPP